MSFEALDHNGRLEIYAEDVGTVIRDGEPLPASDYEYDAEQRRLVVPFSGATTVHLPGASSVF